MFKKKECPEIAMYEFLGKIPNLYLSNITPSTRLKYIKKYREGTLTDKEKEFFYFLFPKQKEIDEANRSQHNQ